jgi:NADPH2:quinone reductase
VIAETNQAVVADAAAPGIFVIRDVAPPEPLPSQAIVAVRAFSLNPGELRTAIRSREPMWPGWDFAGEVVQPAADGSGPPAGARVAGVSLERRAWARRIAIATDRIAQIPDAVSFADACCLPVAGLTALFLLERAGSLLGRSTLITGPSGGVGWYAAQLARLGGARVTAVMRSERGRDQLAACEIKEVIVGGNPFANDRRFDVIVDVIGGASLAASMTHLNEFGHLLVCGNSSEEETQFAPRNFYLQHGASMHGFHLLAELKHRSAAAGLSALAALLAETKLRNWIGHSAPWTDIANVARAYLAREIFGKAVLTTSA